MNINTVNLYAPIQKVIEKTGTNFTLKNAKNSTLNGLTIYGRSEVVEGEIKSVGDDGLTVTTANSDNTVTTSANITTALPLRGVSDTVRDKLICTAESKQVETVCASVDLGTLNWGYRESGQYFTVPISGCINSPTRASGKKPIISGVLTTVTPQYLNDLQDKQICYSLDGTGVYAKNYDYTDASAFKTAMSGVKLIYELATPVTTPLTSAEITNVQNLQTYSPTTNVQNSTNAEMTISYNRRSP